MSIERRNPLPVGRYWVDVFEPSVSPFLAWLSRNQSTVTSLTTERISGSNPEGYWILFTVSAPTLWEGPGFPTIAPTSVKTKADTSERPEPEELPDISDVVGQVGGSTIKLLAFGFGAVLAYKLLTK